MYNSTKLLYMRIQKVLYGLMRSVILFYIELVTELNISISR